MRVDPTESRRVAPLLISALAVVFLIAAGIKFDGLPFIPGARFSDAATSHWGAALYLQRSVIRDHEFPLWRDTILGGQPFAANPLNKTAYPLQWLALILPPALHINLLIVLHMGIACAGMWALARSLGLGAWAAGGSAIAYGLSPRLIAHTGAGHIDILYALAWLPCLLWAVKRAANGSRRGLWLTGVFAGLMFLADVRLSLFGLVLAAAYGVYELRRNPTPVPSPNSGRGANGLSEAPNPSPSGNVLVPSPEFGGDGRGSILFWFAVPALLFLLIASAVIIPLALWSPYLTRAALTPAEAGVFSLQPEYLLGVIFPQSHRNPEVLTYLGIVPLLLALIGAVTARRRVLFWVIAALIAGWYALGSNGLLWNTLTQIAPVLLWFRVPSRAWLIVTLVVALLAGYGVERLKRRPLQIGVLIVVALELTLTGRDWLEWRGADYWLPGSQRAVAEWLIADGVDRVYSPTYSLEQQVAEWYEIDLFYGVDPFQLSYYVRNIQDVGGIESSGYSIIQPPLNGAMGDDLSNANRGAVLDTTAMWYHGVSHVVAAYFIDHTDLTLLDQIDGVYLYQNTQYAGRHLPEIIIHHEEDTDMYARIGALALFPALIALVSGIAFAVRAKS